jgi:hypothetical protein
VRGSFEPIGAYAKPSDKKVVRAHCPQSTAFPKDFLKGKAAPKLKNAYIQHTAYSRVQ